MSKEAKAISSFIDKRFHIETPTQGMIPFKLYDYQQELIESVHDYQYNVITHGRQMGVSTAVLSYLAIASCMSSGHRSIVLTNSETDADAKCQKLKSICDNSIPSVIDSSAPDVIRFLTGSSIMFGTVKHLDILYGVNVQHVFIDNMDHCPEANDHLMMVLAPYAMNNANLTFASSPAGLSSVFSHVRTLSHWKHTHLIQQATPVGDPIGAYDRAMKGL